MNVLKLKILKNNATENETYNSNVVGLNWAIRRFNTTVRPAALFLLFLLFRKQGSSVHTLEFPEILYR